MKNLAKASIRLIDFLWEKIARRIRKVKTKMINVPVIRRNLDRSGPCSWHPDSYGTDDDSFALVL